MTLLSLGSCLCAWGPALIPVGPALRLFCTPPPAELRDQLEASQGEMRAALRARDEKVAALLAELKRSEAQVRLA